MARIARVEPAARRTPGSRVARKPPFPGILAKAPVLIASFIGMVMVCGGVLDRWILTVGADDGVSLSAEPGVPDPPVQVDLASVAGSAVLPSELPESPTLVFTKHRVSRDETLTRIAYEYGLSPATLISVNGLRSPEDIRTGSVLIVPYTDGIRVVPGREDDIGTVAGEYGVEPDGVRELPDGSFFVTGSDIDPEIPARFSENAFLYPVEGKIVTAFGRGIDGLTGIAYESEGVDLSAPAGTSVLASRSGRVVLTGHHSTYGLYVMMSHPGGWKSFYGHLERVDVAVGDELEAGAAIGLSGQSGNARSPRLYFSLIRNGELVDPLDYLF